MSASGGTKAIIAALLANLAIAAGKFVAFLATGSSSMLAESVHSVADSGNQALLIVGQKRAQRRRTREHPFGYGRERYFYAFVVAVVLFTIGALFSLYEGWHKITDPHPIESPQWALGVLLFAVTAEAFSFRTAIRETREVKGDHTWISFIRRAKAPELPVVLLEDLGALLGLTIALVCVTIAAITGNGVWDGVGSLVIGLLLAVIAVVLAIETKSLLIGESAAPEVEERIIQALEETPEVDKVIHLRTLHLGPEELLVAAKIAVHHDDTAAEIAKGINAAEERIRATVPIARVIYVEPDLYAATTGHAATAPEPGAAHEDRPRA